MPTPLGRPAYNQKLGLDRAGAVRDFLVKYGARASQITTTSTGKANPKYPGQKPNFSPTDEARWMNRRVAITVVDDQGRSVGDGSTGDAIRAIQNAGGAGMADCCSEVLKRLDKLDEIQRLLKDLADQNAALRRDLADLKTGQDALKRDQDSLKQGQQVLESKVNTPGPTGPAGANGAGGAGAGAGAGNSGNGRSNPGPFQLLGVNIGADDTGNTTFTGKGRFFAPLDPQHSIPGTGRIPLLQDPARRSVRLRSGGAHEECSGRLVCQLQTRHPGWQPERRNARSGRPHRRLHLQERQDRLLRHEGLFGQRRGQSRFRDGPDYRRNIV